jgi:hypothetical protein
LVAGVVVVRLHEARSRARTVSSKFPLARQPG